MVPEGVSTDVDGLTLRDLARVGQGTHTGPIQTSEALESQLAYIAETRHAHGYSRAVDRLFELVLSYVQDAEDAWRRGENVAWISAPLMPIYYANGVLAIPLSELARLGSVDALAAAEDYFQLPKESCSMVGSILGEFYLRSGRTPPRMVVYNAQCEPLNLAWELLKGEGYEVFRVESVNRPNAEDDPERVAQLQAFLIDEIRRLSLWLTGKPIDEARLGAEIVRSNRIIGKMRRMLRLRVQNPLYIRSLATVYMLAGMSTYYGKPEQYEETLDLLIEELEANAAAPIPHEKVVRLAWVGGRGQEFGVYKTLDDAGGAVTSWHSADDWTRDYRTDLPPLQAFADYLITARTLGSPVRQRKRIEEYLPEFGARGILFYGYIGCSFGSVHREIQAEYFQRLGYPSIFLEGSFQVGPPTGQMLTRVRAFVEMLSR
ncbi:2-hydroxyacyl-CoA dehydratase [Rhodovastum atsumiense]|uniref:2-hydroxyacyl-CoA dehydratase n=1 Tax=Rhodovastum atsumiense TaxID=504468 RepID=A0A5M6IUL3_9PROT|nr:2-hydroxyacyl-CoA dehydratase family protein [Rhodovastum atsumiense]KAA5611984.1 2-hydroxyacyl-CoA dehydratase [Rhodovastum atsumiense]CAH2598764.1 2-hydroxyacyl-CoA dehydratase [Rhodovastum atsumiense]